MRVPINSLKTRNKVKESSLRRLQYKLFGHFISIQNQSSIGFTVLVCFKAENEIEFGFQANFPEYSSNKTDSSIYLFSFYIYFYIQSHTQIERRHIIWFSIRFILSVRVRVCLKKEREKRKKKVKKLMSHLKQGDRKLQIKQFSIADGG